MRIENAAGEYLELRVAGYEFPSIQAGDWDANWLLIEINARRFEGAVDEEWSFRHPCMTTLELEGLVEWLEDVARGGHPGRLEFTEPLVTFAVEGSTLRVALELEARPPSRQSSGEGWQETALELPADQEIVHSAAADLRADLARYPARGDWAQRTSRA